MARLDGETVIRPGDLVEFDDTRHHGSRLWTDCCDDEGSMAGESVVGVPTTAIMFVIWISEVHHPSFPTDVNAPHKTLVASSTGVVGYTWSTYVKRV